MLQRNQAIIKHARNYETISRSDKSESDIGHGWAWLVLIASYGTKIIVCTSMYMSGVLYIAFLDRYKEGPGKTSIIGALNTGLYAILGPLASMFINRFSCRISMILGGLICALGYFIGYFLDSIDMFIVVLGLFVGVGIALAHVPNTVVLAYYFKEKRRLIISMASVASGTGMFVASPLCLYLLENYGLRGTLLIISGLNLQTCVFGMICRPSSLELEVQRENKERSFSLNQKQRNTTLSEKAHKLKRTLNVDLLLNLPFLFFLLSLLSWGFMYSLCLVHLPNYVVRTDAVNADITGVMSAFSISTICGRILSALTVENGGLDSLTLHIGMCGVIGSVTLLLPLYSDLPGSVYVYAGITGAYLGGLNCLLCPIILMLVGVEKYSTGYGMSFLFSGVGQIIGPYLGGLIFGFTRSYNSTFVIGGLVALCGSILGMLSSVKAKQRCDDNSPLNKYTTEIEELEELDGDSTTDANVNRQAVTEVVDNQEDSFIVS